MSGRVEEDGDVVERGGVGRKERRRGEEEIGKRKEEERRGREEGEREREKGKW
jgi:hypothetical protein